MRTTDEVLLFVYGTLLDSAQHPMGRLLQEHATHMGSGWFRGRLYIIDDPEEPGNRYPGAVPSGYEEDKVFGELFHLSDPEQLLPRFDVYEACDSSRPQPHEFQRRLVEVVLDSGRSHRAICYLYAWDTSRASLVDSGRFAESMPNAR